MASPVGVSRDSVVRKRPRGTPTLTPTRPIKRQPIREIVTQQELVLPVAQLSLTFQNRGLPWSEEECQFLIEYILLMTDGNNWPIHKDMSFWECAGKFVQQRLKARHLRTGIAI